MIHAVLTIVDGFHGLRCLIFFALQTRNIEK